MANNDWYTQIAEGADRSFEIMVGLREGYSNERHGPEHTVDEVIQAHHDWQYESDCVLGVFVTAGRLSYGWPHSGHIRSADEPACTVSGNINVIYNGEMSDSDAREIVLSLAVYLARRFDQTRIYARFNGISYVLHRAEAETPTGEYPSQRD